MALTHRELDKLRKEAKNNRDEFWEDIADKLTWDKRWDKVCDSSDHPITKWFVGGEINLCYNAVDRHIKEGYGNLKVLYMDSPVSETKKKFTYSQIHDEVTRLAGVLKEYGVVKGDRIMILMPMIVEGVFAMLASTRLGCTHCALPGGLPSQDLMVRIDHYKPKVILIASHGYHGNGWVNYKEILDDACSKTTHKPEKVLCLKRKDKVKLVKGRDEDWASTVKNAKPMLECTPMEATEPLFVIYTSGSTGAPKAIVHAVGGYLVRMTCDTPVLFGYGNSDEMVFMTSSFGWIAGHTIVVYSPLLMRLKTLIFEGDPLLTSDVHALYRLLTENRVTRPIVRPGILKLLKSMDPDGKVASKYDFRHVRQMYVGGERTDRKTLEWATRIFDTSIWNAFGQTEASSVITGCPDASFGKTTHRVAIATKPLPGWDVVVLKPDNTEAKPNEMGRILVRLPLPPGGLVSLLGDHERCKQTYFKEYEGYYDTKDEGFMDEEGCLSVECRADDVMKHASVYLAAQSVEEVVLSHPDVAECVVIGIPDLVLKEIPVILYMVKSGTKKSASQVSDEIIERSNQHFGSAVTFGKAIQVKVLPRTRTGKIHRPSVAALGRGQKLPSTGAVENPEVLNDIDVALKKAGYGKTAE